MSKSDTFRFDIRLIFLGFFVALFSAGIGIGGGTLFVSFFMSLFGFDFKKAASTSLASIIPICFIGSLSHFMILPEITNLRHYFIFIPACMLGAVLGTRIVRKHQNGWSKLAFSLFLIIVSLRMLVIFDFPFLIYSGLDGILSSHDWLLIVPIGIFIGIIAVALGIGCGLLIVPFYVIVMDFNIHESITLSLTTMFFMTLSATVIHKKFKSLDIIPLKSIFIPAIAGAVVGAMISGNLPAPILKKLFGMFLFIIACNYIIRDMAMRFKPAVPVKTCRERIKQTSWI